MNGDKEEKQSSLHMFTHFLGSSMRSLSHLIGADGEPLSTTPPSSSPNTSEKDPPFNESPYNEVLLKEYDIDNVFLDDYQKVHGMLTLIPIDKTERRQPYNNWMKVHEWNSRDRMDEDMRGDEGYTRKAYPDINEQFAKDMALFSKKSDEEKMDLLRWLLILPEENVDALILLLKAGVDVTLKRGMTTPLMYAAEKGYLETAIWLMKAREHAHIFEPTDEKSAALFSALIYRQYKMAELLLSAGANIEATDKYGETPLLFLVNQISDSRMDDMIVNTMGLHLSRTVLEPRDRLKRQDTLDLIGFLVNNGAETEKARTVLNGALNEALRQNGNKPETNRIKTLKLAKEAMDSRPSQTPTLKNSNK